MQAQLLPCIISLADSDVIKRGLMEKESKLENNSSNNRSKKDNTNWSPVLGPSATLGPAVMNIQLPVLIPAFQTVSPSSVSTHAALPTLTYVGKSNDSSVIIINSVLLEYGACKWGSGRREL